MAKRSITPGITTQTEILEIFGPPDLVTHKDGADVWTYDKTRYEVQASGSYATVLVVGGSQQRMSSSSTSTMLIIYFGPDEKVKDYRLSATKS